MAAATSAFKTNNTSHNNDKSKMNNNKNNNTSNTNNVIITNNYNSSTRSNTNSNNESSNNARIMLIMHCRYCYQRALSSALWRFFAVECWKGCRSVLKDDKRIHKMMKAIMSNEYELRAHPD